MTCSAPCGGGEDSHAVSGADGSHTVDFRDLAARGITLVGRTLAYDDGSVTFGQDLGKNLEQGDANYLAVLAHNEQSALVSSGTV